MSLLTRSIKAVYNFLVGDMRILLGTLIALIIIGLAVRATPSGAGVLLFILLTITLTLSLRHELAP